MSRKKKFAITASDRYLGVFKAFLAQGWEPVKLFTVPIFDPLASNRQTIALAEAHKLPIQMSPMVERDLAELAALDCELLVVASYQWRIGDWTPYLPRAINFHPSLLPQYRGPYPQVQGLLDQQTQWGITCHKLAPTFDSGDILAVQRFDLTADECHESLDLKVQMGLARLAERVAPEVERLWNQAQPQGPGSFAHLWSDADRTLDFRQGAQALGVRLRAFGNFECIAPLGSVNLHVRRAVCWQEAHRHAPGTVVHSDGQSYVVACADGYVGLLEWSLVPAGAPMGSARRP